MAQIQIPNGTLAAIADYTDQKLDEYNTNPMIRALPTIFSDEDFVDLVTRMPNFSEEEIFWESQFRFHCVERLSRYFFPLNQTVALQKIVSTLLMQGYLARNPLEPEYARRANQIYEAIKEGGGKNLEEYISVPTSASSFSLIGPSGMGKSTNLKNILNLYPQVIAHPEHNAYQVVWIKIDCSHAGSLKGLCIDFFLELDRLLGTNYFKKFGSTRKTEDTMLAQMVQLAHTHHLGMLVIDEMQNLVNAKRSKDDLLNFLVKMDNIIGVPVVRVGTNEAYPILQGNFRNARRGIGQGGVLWNKLEEEERDNISEWQLFVGDDGMWEYQWTKNYTPFTAEISQALYYETQGIIDLVVKLFKMVQWRAIAEGGDEFITVDLIHEVAEEGLCLVKPMLDAIREGDLQKMAKYKDISPVSTMEFQHKYASQLQSENIKDIIRSASKKRNKRSRILHAVIYNLVEELDIDPPIAKISAEAVVNNTDSIDIKYLIKEAYKVALQGGRTTKAKVIKTKLTPVYQENDMRLIVAKAKEQGISAYDALKEAGFIKNPIDDFINVS